MKSLNSPLVLQKRIIAEHVREFACLNATMCVAAHTVGLITILAAAMRGKGRGFFMLIPLLHTELLWIFVEN